MAALASLVDSTSAMDRPNTHLARQDASVGTEDVKLSASTNPSGV